MRGLLRMNKNMCCLIMGFIMMLAAVFAWEAEVHAEKQDKKAPVVTEITIDKQGQVVDGIFVNITITAWDESGFRENETAIINLCNPNLPNYNFQFELKEIAVSEDGKTKTYSKDININSMKSGEWEVGDFYIYDAYGNDEATCANTIDLDSYYFYVPGEYEEITYGNVTVGFYDKEYECIYKTEASTLPRRVKLSELFGDKWIDALENHEKLGKFVGWTYNGKLVTKDSTILIPAGDEVYQLCPLYEQKEIDVHYEYLKPDEGICSECKAIILPKDATYAELWTEIEKQITLPVVEHYNFLGWETNAIYEEWDIIDEQGGFWIEAKYDNYPVIFELLYIDENFNVIETTYMMPGKYGETEKDVYERFLKEFDPAIANTIDEWDGYVEEDNIIDGQEYIELTALYDDKIIAEYSTYYLTNSEESDEYAVETSVEEKFAITKEQASDKEQFISVIKEKLDLNYYDGLPDPVMTFEVNMGDYDYYESAYIYNKYSEQQFVVVDEYYFPVEKGDIVYLDMPYWNEDDYEGPMCWYLGDDDEYYTGSYIVPEDNEEKYIWFYKRSWENVEDDAIINEGPTRPEPPVEIPNDFSAVLEDEADAKEKVVLTEAEKAAIAGGDTFDVVLTFVNVGTEVDNDEKKAIEEQLGDNMLGTFLNIELIKKVGLTATEVSEATGLITVTFEMPEELKNKDQGVIRTYKIMRNHNGQVESLDAVYDAITGKVSFETDRFSTYALVYYDVELSGKMGDVNNDGNVDTSDAQAIFNHFMGIATFEDEAVLKAADVNNDGNVDTSDAQMVFNMFMGII